MKFDYLGGVAISALSLLFSSISLADEFLDPRIEAERESHSNPFVITQNHANYILPYTYVSNVNQSHIDVFDGAAWDQSEAKYQISIKAPLYSIDPQSLEGVYFAFTLKSWWQVYNTEMSSPFRETNYEPEVVYAWNPNVELGDLKVVSSFVSLNHQSNGRHELFSRSWNRIIAGAVAETENYFFAFRAWHRLEEDPKENPDDAVGDDNPDILDYMGNFELTVGTRLGETELSLTTRNLLQDASRGYYELNVSYPINKRFDLLFQYVNGYGESLIDYDHRIERFGLGIQFARF